jgi:hypothetical protein
LEREDEIPVKDCKKPMKIKKRLLCKRRSIKEKVLRRLMKHARKLLYIWKKRMRRILQRLHMSPTPLVARPTKDLLSSLGMQGEK